jgi:hypothetical protein
VLDPPSMTPPSEPINVNPGTSITLHETGNCAPATASTGPPSHPGHPQIGDPEQAESTNGAATPLQNPDVAWIESNINGLL